MANGILPGSGTKSEHFLVEDGRDFDALRNIPTSVSEHVYIEITNDISLAMFPLFAPIPTKHFNIDGKSHAITGINISSGTSMAGLFLDLHSDDYIKNIVLEGRVSCNNSGTITCGGVCNRLTLRSNAVVSNVECHMSLSFSAGSGLTAGGLFGVVEITGAGSRAISECAFKGTMEAGSSNTGTTFSMIVAGIVGQLWNAGGANDYTFMIDRCFTHISYRINSRINLHLSGIFSRTGQGFNTATTSYPIMINKCVAKMRVQFTHPGAFANNTTQAVCGIACVVGNFTGQVATVEKCATFVDILWTHQFALRAFHLSGLLHRGSASGQRFTINQGYAVIRMINPDNLPWEGITGSFGSVTFLPSTQPTVGVNDAFFDVDIFAESYDGEFTQTHGITTAELQSQAFLEARGWEFKDE